MWTFDPTDACGGTALLFSLFTVEDNFNAVALLKKFWNSIFHLLPSINTDGLRKE